MTGPQAEEQALDPATTWFARAGGTLLGVLFAAVVFWCGNDFALPAWLRLPPPIGTVLTVSMIVVLIAAFPVYGIVQFFSPRLQQQREKRGEEQQEAARNDPRVVLRRRVMKGVTISYWLGFLSPVCVSLLGDDLRFWAVAAVVTATPAVVMAWWAAAQAHPHRDTAPRPVPSDG